MRVHYLEIVTPDVDAARQPRARTVRASPPDEEMMISIATRPSSRKVDQIRGHDRVTLFLMKRERVWIPRGDAYRERGSARGQRRHAAGVLGDAGEGGGEP